MTTWHVWMSLWFILSEKRWAIYNDLVTFSWFGDKTHNFSNDVMLFVLVWGWNEVQLWILSPSGNKQLCAFLSNEAKSWEYKNRHLNIATPNTKEGDKHSSHMLTGYESWVRWIIMPIIIIIIIMPYYCSSMSLYLYSAQWQ